MAEEKKEIENLREKIRQTFQDVANEKGYGFDDSRKSFSIYSKRWHSVEFRFQWIKNHYVVKFVGYDSEGKWKASQAIVSIWTYADAIEFLAAFKILFDMPAKRKIK
ncbi:MULTISPECIES: hypothetical protein [unclassified Fibrobacter]|uniref:hypothetical protein n=1 Tax=unclassified Fibrobacter TaxID=2634177 RepID=UPI00091C24A1|nr:MULTISPECIES: hypothetical protein [Fibrobacter]MCL4102889.1 hypothetical protein [Fibrobacter succinogenes]MCQ2109531.1 hypothetical protein [Fibrobacter sp.]SHK42824.1 hypothetical protein SAMN05720765_102213 [Fibrobacter sp. UWH6]